jgi:hypothetical protein
MSGRWSSCCCGSSACGPVVIQRMIGDRETLGTFVDPPTNHFLIDQIFDASGVLAFLRPHCGQILPGGDPFHIEDFEAGGPWPVAGGITEDLPTPDRNYSYIGVYRTRVKNSNPFVAEYVTAALMRIYGPAIGSIGYYEGREIPPESGNDPGQANGIWDLVSVETAEPATDGYIEVTPDEPRAIGTPPPFAVSVTRTYAVFFPGVDPEFVPATWTSPKTFPV